MSLDKPLIKLSLPEWSHEQKLAVARVSAQALTQSAPILGETWSCQWWEDVITYLSVSQQELESRVLHSQQAVEVLSTNSRDIRIEVLIDILALALQINNEKKGKVMLYDARSRRFLVHLEQVMSLSSGDLASVEKSISQQMYYALLETQVNTDGSTMQQDMDLSARKAINNTNKKKNAFKWLATGAGIIGGGALIGMFIEFYNIRHIYLLCSFDRWSCSSIIGSFTSRCYGCYFFRHGRRCCVSHKFIWSNRWWSCWLENASTYERH